MYTDKIQIDKALFNRLEKFIQDFILNNAEYFEDINDAEDLLKDLQNIY